MGRDRRISIALVLFATSLGSLLIQGWILFVYVHSALNQNWTYFSEKFPSYVRQIPEGAYCLDDCSPDLPFVAGRIGIASFLAALCVLTHVWWTSRPRDAA